MDQKVVAGVGNVYRAEVLFRHGIDPYRQGKDLDRAEWDEVWADLGALMREGVRNNRIDTVRPEHLPEASRAAPARRRPRRRGVRLPPRQAGLPHLRHRDPYGGPGGPQPLLVPGLPAVRGGPVGTPRTARPQKPCGHHGCTSEEKASAADASAPSRNSLTFPAPASIVSDTPPR